MMGVLFIRRYQKTAYASGSKQFVPGSERFHILPRHICDQLAYLGWSCVTLMDGVPLMSILQAGDWAKV